MFLGLSSDFLYFTLLLDFDILQKLYLLLIAEELLRITLVKLEIEIK